MLSPNLFDVYILLKPQDKMNKSYEEGSIEWESFGKVQEYIRDQIRKDERDNLLPTFQEFADFIAEE